MRRTFRTLNDYEMQYNAEVGLFTRPSKVIKMQPEDKRSFVRGYFPFEVKFKAMTKDEYEDLKKSNEANYLPFKQEWSVDTDNGQVDNESSEDALLLNYLVQMDEKLDLILKLLSKDTSVKKLFNEGMAQNISGSGMNIIAESPVESEEIIHLKFYLSKYPLVFMDLFGEVVNVTKKDKDNRTWYYLGIKFLDLKVNDREKIISSVFQRQREAIRKRKVEA